jgi:hypothetical protein
MHDFKLLAIRPMPDCDPQLLKILKKGEFYFFDNTYQPREDQRWIRKIDPKTSQVPRDFFFKKGISGSSLESINVQALVGKNGEGKSSLTDLALRILNNFFKAIEVHPVTKNLVYVNKLAAELYFSISEKVYRISVNALHNGFQAVMESLTEQSTFKTEDRKTVLEKLFFVINVNYSHYALNSIDFFRESHQEEINKKVSWLDKVFHRNDGYQTPLTVHPFRTQGNININIERDLINQRLLTLILTEPSYEMINSHLKATGIQFEKFELSPIQNLIERITKEFEGELNNDSGKIEYRNYVENMVLSEIGGNFLSEQLNTYIHRRNESAKKEAKSKRAGGKKAIFKRITGTPQQLTQKYLALLDDDGLTEILKLSHMCIAVSQEVTNVREETPLQRNLYEYLCVKAYKMLRYPQFSKVIDLIKERNQNDAISLFRSYLESESIHVSLKFSQAYQLLQLLQKRPKCKLAVLYQNFHEGDQRSKLVPLSDLKECLEEVFELTHYDIPRIFFNPPAIFKKSIILQSGEDGSESTLADMSSGEYQKTGLISSIVYHLTNLDSIQKGMNEHTNEYQNVLLILDEIELYFHPDFQRTLLNELLNRLKQVQFRKIKAINILFVTHSPFVLSDVPLNNVMFIEDGRQCYPMSENTFGANIHTLLQHGFFLKGVPIGEFARNKINELFDTLSKPFKNGVEEDLEQRILMVSEPFLRSQLLKLYHQRVPAPDVSKLLQRIEELENKIK